MIFLNKENSGISIIDKMIFYFQRLFSSSINKRRNNLSTFIFEENEEQNETSSPNSTNSLNKENSNRKEEETNENSNGNGNTISNFNVKLFAIEILTTESIYNQFWLKLLSPIEPTVEHKVVNSNSDPSVDSSSRNESHLWIYKYSFSSGPLLYIIIEKSQKKKKFFSHNVNKITSLHFTVDDLESLENFLSKKHQISRLSVDQQVLYQSFVSDSKEVGEEGEKEEAHILENQIMVNVSGIDFLFVKQNSILF